MNSKNLSKPKVIAGIFAGASFLAGFFFLDRRMTGNVVLNGDLPPFDILSLIGLGLVACSAILALYIIRE